MGTLVTFPNRKKTIPSHLAILYTILHTFLKSSIQEAEVRVPKETRKVSITPIRLQKRKIIFFDLPIRNGDQGSPEPTKKKEGRHYTSMYTPYI
jgi:hypothetical protein